MGGWVCKSKTSRNCIYVSCTSVMVLIALLLSLLTGGALFAQLERLMEQVEAGKFKAVDFDNFDEFF